MGREEARDARVPGGSELAHASIPQCISSARVRPSMKAGHFLAEASSGGLAGSMTVRLRLGSEERIAAWAATSPPNVSEVLTTRLHRLTLVAIASVSVSACGAASTPPAQVFSSHPPTYAQVLLAMAKEQSVHIVEDLAPGAVGDVKGDLAGDIAGTVTVGTRSFQFYARLITTSAGHLGTAHYDMIPNAAFVAGCACHVRANTCVPFSPALQAQSGLNADGIATLFTPEGITHQVTAGAAAMTVQGNTVVAEQPVNIFKGSGLELDVPYGSKLPIRFVRADGTTVALSEWGATGPITKPAACP